MKWNDRGFSLLETSIALGILGMGALAVANMMSNQGKTIQTLEFKMKKLEIRSFVTSQFLGDGNNCNCLFANAAPADFSDSVTDHTLVLANPINDLGQFKLTTPNDCTTSTIPRPYLSTSEARDGVKLAGVSLEKITALGSGRFAGELHIRVESVKQILGPSTALLSIPVNVQATATTPGNVKFAGCAYGGIGQQLSATLANTSSHETRVCYRNDGLHNITVSCPAGKGLIACSGGEGDIDEDHEGSWIIPDYTNHTCTLVVKKPRCVSGESWTEQRILAFCYQL